MSEHVYGSPVQVLAKDVGAATPLPSEFRIFAPGVNESSKGPAVFDVDAARDVMATYMREGVDLMVDLNHESLAAPIREDSGDARGWFQLELRGMDRRAPELWAVNVRWTPDGERRLREGVQKYISPTFAYDKKTNRVRRVLNVALVAMPATYNAQPLIAASRITPSARARAYLLLQRFSTK